MRKEEYVPGTRRNEEGMLYRYMGRSGLEISVIGLGGSHMGKIKDREECIRLIRNAVDRGITFMDNSWDYEEGESESRMGEALKGGYRQRVVLMTKIDARTKEAAAKQIDESLTRLKADHVDLMQFHEVIRMEDPDRIFAEGGAMEAMVEAQKAGKVRFIGFTGHKDPFIHIRMLDLAAKHGFRFDAVQMPLNVMDAHFRSFEHTALPILVKERIGVLGMKCMGGGEILESGLVNPTECLHYALNLPLSTMIAGIEDMEMLNNTFEAVRNFKPLTDDEVSALLSRTKEAALSGKYELFKTHVVYDMTTKHPEYMGYEVVSG